MTSYSQDLIKQELNVEDLSEFKFDNINNDSQIQMLSTDVLKQIRQTANKDNDDESVTPKKKLM